LVRTRSSACRWTSSASTSSTCTTYWEPRAIDWPGGHILQVSSVGGVLAFPTLGLYHASKWDLEAFSEALAQEVTVFLGSPPLPRAAVTLGFEFLDADVERGTIQLAFAATDDFTSPLGNILGAFQAAMLYDTVGPALIATLAPDEFQST
jgi:hypothetical protein